MNMKRCLPLASVLASAWLGACAGGAQPSGATPADIPVLEAERGRHPTDAALLQRLGVAYYDAKDYAHARDVFASVLVLDKVNYPATLYLGFSLEELGMLDSARSRYNEAARLANSDKQKDEIQGRLALLTRKQLQQAAREAIAQEATLSQQPPTENTIAVFPFRYVGTNEDLRPLERGLTHLVITDLSRVGKLKLLERERVQALVDELQLADAGRVDPSTGARSGRLLRASQVVQGSVQDLPADQRLRLDVDAVNATTADIVAAGSAANKLQQLFDIEKQAVFQLLQRMGIALTPAEQRAISERPTADLQAFLSFSRGLEAEDHGDFAAAEADFNAAVTRDPNFRAARDRQAQSARLSNALTESPLQLAGPIVPISTPGATPGPRTVTLRNAISVTVPSTSGQLTTRIGTTPPVVRPPLPEALGQDNPGIPPLVGNIIIIITRP